MQHPEPHDLTALAYDMIEGPEREQLLEHLASCDACREIYDSYRTEQTEVRESIMRDARSGASEARALEATLRMLSGASEPKARGRLIQLPRWVIVAEIAAVLVVAVALVFVLKPDPADQVVPVAEAARAPADVEGGVVYVSDRQGDWLPADGVPMDEVVKAGQGQQVRLALTDGSRMLIEPGSLFRVSADAANAGRPMVYLLSGVGEVDASSAPGSLYVRAGDAGFIAMPSSRFAVNLKGGEDTSVNAQVFEGDVVLWPERGGHRPVPMRHGEKAEWTFDGVRFVGGHFDAHAEMHSELVIRLDQIFERAGAPGAGWQEHPYHGKRLEELWRVREDHQRRILVQVMEPSVKFDEFMFSINDESLTLSSNGKSLLMTLLARSGTSRFEGQSFDDLRPHVPETFAAKVQELEARRDAAGQLRIVKKGR